MKKVLVLAFIDADGNDYNMTISNPADSLQKSMVMQKMAAIIDSTAILTPQGKTLATASDAYYKVTEIVPLADAGGGE